MKKIQKLADQICEELEGAREYAETALEFKAYGNSSWYSKYRGMAEDELQHSQILHERVVEEIEALSKVYTPPAGMEEKWKEVHKKYVEKSSWIKTMLQM